LFEEGILVIEKRLECRPEFLVYFFRFCARQSTYDFPLLLNFQDLFGLLVPFLNPVGLEIYKLLNCVAKRSLVAEVYLEFLLKILKVSITACVYRIRCGFKALPHSFLVILWNRSDVFEFV